MINKKYFRRICDEAFLFLNEYEMCCVMEKYDRDSYEIHYTNKVVGVAVIFEFRDFYPFVKLAKLENGCFPLVSGEIQPETVLNSFDLDDIVGMRSCKSLIPCFDSKTVFNSLLIKKLLCHQANNLRLYAKDILNADFSLFPALEKVVKRRAKKAAIDKWGDDGVE